ncbi:MAG: T9SS type A sorting domain-containing protein [Ignavibacteria bacterium]|nr:T9SS type A sorting domain-containing protein [Ignavibacteria bacterium]
MRKAILTLFILFLFSITVYGQYDYNPNKTLSSSSTTLTDNSQVITASWAPLAASPNANSRAFCVAISVNDTVHIYQFGGGGSAATLASVVRYNTRTNAWSTLALNGAALTIMPVTMSAGSAVAFGDSVIFVFGGEGILGANYGKAAKYNVKTNTWTTLANIPSAVTDAGVFKYRDSLVYIVGGGDGLFSPTPTVTFNTVHIYNTKRNTYSSGGTYPVSAGMMGIGIIGDTVIAAGGWNGTAAISNAYKGIINPATLQITWSAIAAYPAGTITRMASYQVRKGNGGGVVFSCGAIGGSTLTGNTYLYDMCAGTWNTLTANSTARSNLKGTGLGDSVMYVVAGFTTVGVGTTDRLTFSQIDGSCFTPPTPTTLVLLHDTTITSSLAKRLADRDTLFKYLPSLISGYDIAYYNTSSNLPSLTNYKTIIIQETSFDGSFGNLGLSPSAKTDLKTWIASGSAVDKRALLQIGGDFGYYYDRSSSTMVDTTFARQVGGYQYIADHGENPPDSAVVGVAIDAGNSRVMTNPPTAIAGFYPDACKPVNGAVVLTKYSGRVSTDSSAGIGKVGTTSVVATMLQDPRYFKAGQFKPLLQAFIAYIKSNGGTILSTTPQISSVADKYSLSQNYPNPFNPSTKISFSIPVNGFVSLKVYDVTGKEVMTLVNKNMTVGSYSVDFNGTFLSSGAYFYRLESGNFVETKKMMLVK